MARTSGSKTLTVALASLTLSIGLACTAGPPEMLHVTEGLWGMRGCELNVDASGATIMFDCAAGTLEQPLETDDAGSFSVPGILVRFGGPSPWPPPSRAEYAGRVTGDTMDLTITLTATGEELGPFTLTFGQTGDLFPCG